jgi:hypothetical protein
MTSNTELMLAPDVARLIHSVRDQRVILDADLARLYGVPTKVLNQAVKRNAFRFPADFLFRLTPAEAQALMRSQIVTASPGIPATEPSKRNIRYLPYGFTEHGTTALNSAFYILHSAFRSAASATAQTRNRGPRKGGSHALSRSQAKKCLIRG